LQERHAIAESENEDWELYVQDEGDEDYDGQLQDFNNERLNTLEIRKELNLTVKPSAMIHVGGPMGSYQGTARTSTDSWSTVNSVSTIFKDFEENQRNVFGPSAWQERRERFQCVRGGVTQEEHCAINDAMPYGGMKYKPIPRRARPRGETARKHCVQILMTLGFFCCCITPCAFNIWRKQKAKYQDDEEEKFNLNFQLNKNKTGSKFFKY